MIRIDVLEAQAHLSRYLERVESGETIVISRLNVPVAELRAVPVRRLLKRPIGLARGRFEVTDAFFEPLPRDLAEAFEGGGDAAP